MKWNPFSIALSDAVEAAEVGFYFEEGGCWGMADALARFFESHGFSPVIRYMPKDFTHCWVDIDGRGFDHQGKRHSNYAGVCVTDLASLPAIASEFGVDHEDLMADSAQAAGIISNAAKGLSFAFA